MPYFVGEGGEYWKFSKRFDWFPTSNSWLSRSYFARFSPGTKYSLSLSAKFLEYQSFTLVLPRLWVDSLEGNSGMATFC